MFGTYVGSLAGGRGGLPSGDLLPASLRDGLSFVGVAAGKSNLSTRILGVNETGIFLTRRGALFTLFIGMPVVSFDELDECEFVSRNSLPVCEHDELSLRLVPSVLGLLKYGFFSGPSFDNIFIIQLLLVMILLSYL